MTDDEVVAYLAGQVDSAAGPGDTTRLERSRSLLADPALWSEPSPDLEQRIVDAVTAASRPAVVSGPASVSDGPAVTDLAESRRRSSHRLRNALLGAAAAVILAVGVATVITTTRDHPMQFAAAVKGTPLAPSATGSVTMTKTSNGWRIHLDATGLPRLDNGRYYQAWLKNSAGTLVPIGTFNQAHDVTLWSGVAPSDYPTVTVTRQQADSGPASSGQKVLVGTSHRTH
jgi:Anti-sigma-K factor rskA